MCSILRFRVKAPSTPKLVSTVIEYRDAEIFKPMDFLDSQYCSRADGECVADCSKNSSRDINWREFDNLSSFANDDDLNKRTGLLMECFVSGNGDGVFLDALDDGTGLFHIWQVDLCEFLRS